MQPSSRGFISKLFSTNSGRRIGLWYAFLIIVCSAFGMRLFYLQIIKHDYYRQAALADQLKQYSIPAERGIIEVHDAGGIVPLALNQKMFTLYADPSFAAKEAESHATKIANVIGGKASHYQMLMKVSGSRYQVLAKRLNSKQKDAITNLKLSGIGTQAQDYRIYPQGNLAAQLLGFVDDSGQGRYGIEEALNKELAGKAGMLKSITDVRGIPLAASRDNTQIDPIPGQNTILTLNLAMQKQLETTLRKGIKRALAPSGSALIIDVNDGAVKAMANWPSYDPSKFYEVKDQALFQNATVSAPLEVGSIMKALTMAAALDLGKVTPKTTYYDPSQWKIDGHIIKNVEEDGGAAQRTMPQLLNLSLNTGATWLLMQMGDGKINQKARETWHDYMVNHYRFGKSTGIEQGYEQVGYIPSPTRGDALNLTYANTAFGQSMAATPLQMAAALAAVVNGGTYYQPRLVDKTIDKSGKETVKQPIVVSKDVVDPKVSPQIQKLLEYVLVNHSPQPAFSSKYSVGGKTGTAQLAAPGGGYYADRFNGTFMGFVGGDKPQYVIMVEVDTPRIGGYAGTAAAMPIFVDLAHMLINNFNVLPRSR